MPNSPTPRSISFTGGPDAGGPDAYGPDACRDDSLSYLAQVEENHDGVREHFRAALTTLIDTSKFSIDIGEVEARMAKVQKFEELADWEPFRTPAGRKFLILAIDRLKDLWNYTPRREFAGRSPTLEHARLVTAGAKPSKLSRVPLHLPYDFPRFSSLLSPG